MNILFIYYIMNLFENSNWMYVQKNNKQNKFFTTKEININIEDKLSQEEKDIIGKLNTTSNKRKKMIQAHNFFHQSFYDIITYWKSSHLNLWKDLNKLITNKELNPKSIIMIIMKDGRILYLGLSCMVLSIVKYNL
jgi:hypothetical protein